MLRNKNKYIKYINYLNIILNTKYYIKMSQSKYITYIYKISTIEDNLKIFISSTKENLQTLLLFYTFFKIIILY